MDDMKRYADHCIDMLESFSEDDKDARKYVKYIKNYINSLYKENYGLKTTNANLKGKIDRYFA